MHSLSNGVIRLTFVLAYLFFGLSQAFAQSGDYEYTPIAFGAPLELPRGKFLPVAEGGQYLTDADACHIVVSSWGWDRSSCREFDKILITPNTAIDTLIIESPNSDGFVTFEDWNHEDRDSEIHSIWRSLQKQTLDQSKKLGEEIVLDDWLVRPTLDQKNQFLYYATQMTWGDERIINIKAVAFDRRGYVSFLIIPVDSYMPEYKIKSVIDDVLKSYKSKPTETYADFTDGDKIATAGTLGVLAALVGVKYGKLLAAGLFALLITFSKKFWFVILVPLIIGVRKMIGR